MGCFTSSLHELFNDFKVEFNLEMPNDKTGGIIKLKDKKQIFRPSFHDYLQEGEQISLCVGIDFTLGNREFTFPDSMHILRTDGGMNAYQTAM